MILGNFSLRITTRTHNSDGKIIVDNVERNFVGFSDGVKLIVVLLFSVGRAKRFRILGDRDVPTVKLSR
jgi:hypothetical protein